MRFGWPDFRGRTVVCIATGPSLTKADVERVHARRNFVAVIAVCDAGLDVGRGRDFSAPWADIHYAADYHFWRLHKPCTGAFRVAATQTSGQPSPLDCGLVDAELTLHEQPIALTTPGHVYNGKHSGIHAAQLAVTLGATDVVLLGYDCRTSGRVHNYCEKAREISIGFSGDRLRWTARYDEVDWRVPVTNCSPHSAIPTFERTTLEQLWK